MYIVWWKKEWWCCWWWVLMKKKILCSLSGFRFQPNKAGRWTLKVIVGQFNGGFWQFFWFYSNIYIKIKSTFYSACAFVPVFFQMDPLHLKYLVYLLLCENSCFSSVKSDCIVNGGEYFWMAPTPSGRWIRCLISLMLPLMSVEADYLINLITVLLFDHLV